MTRSRRTSSAVRPAWLEQAPDELRPILQIGFDMFGDDPPAIADWLSKLHDYKQFWNIVEQQAPSEVLTRYAEAAALRERIAYDRQHPELRTARPPRRTA